MNWIEGLGSTLEKFLLPFMANFVADGSHFASGLAYILIGASIATMLAISVFRVLPAWLSIHIRQRHLSRLYQGATTPEEKRRALSENFVDLVDPALGNGFDEPKSRILRSTLLKVGREHQLRLAWTEFKETIVDESVEGEIRNTERPQSYFQRAINNPQRYAELAGIFVSVGLLLTFIGIISVLLKAGCVMQPPEDLATSSCAAFGDATTAVDGEQALLMQAAVISIVAGAASKFYASIGGLAGSIIVRIWVGNLAALMRRKLEHFSDEVEAGLAFMPEQTLAQKQLEALTEQSTQLKKFNTDFAVTMGEAMTQAMAPVSSQLGRIEQGLSDQREQLTSGVGDAVNKMAGGEIRELGRVLTDLRSELSGISGTLSAGGDAAAQQMQQASSTLAEMTDRLQQNFLQMTRDVRQAGHDANAQFVGSASQMGEVLQGALEAIRSSSMQNSQRLSDIGERLDGITQDFGLKAQDSFQRALSVSSEQTAQSLTHAGEKMRESMSEAFQDWSSTLDEAVGGISRLNGGMAQSADAIDRQIGNLQAAANSTEQAGRALQAASSSLQSVSSPVQAAVERLSRAVDVVDSSVSKLTETSADAFSKVQSISDSMQRTMDAANEAWSSYEARFGDVDEKLGDVLNNLSGSVESNAERMRKYVSEIDRELAQAVSQFATSVQPISNLADEIEELNREMNRRVVNGGAS